MPIRPLLSALLLAAAIGSLSACGSNDRPFRYLEDQPELGLAFPGATLVSESRSPEVMTVEGPISAHVDKTYEVGTGAPEVVAWYSEKLAALGWRSDGLYGNGRHQWTKGFVQILLGFAEGSADEASGVVQAELQFWTQPSVYDTAPLASLRDIPELSLAFPGATTRTSELELGRSTSARRVRPAKIERRYETFADAEDLIRYYERDLATRGWEMLDGAPGDVGVGLQPDRVWRKGAVVAGLSIFPRRPSPSTNGYAFTIAEITDAKPGLPWE